MGCTLMKHTQDLSGLEFGVIVDKISNILFYPLEDNVFAQETDDIDVSSGLVKWIPRGNCGVPCK